MESSNRADKTLIHISHLHPLKLVASPEPKPICLACNMPCADQSYGCILCNYFLHMICATTRRRVDHPSHPAHTLNFELAPSYPHGKYGCNACGVDGTSFSLRCKDCSYDLHLHCAAIHHKINHHSHHHLLTIEYTNPFPPGTVGVCSMCNKYVDVEKWFYTCTEGCIFGGHIGCFSSERQEVLSPGLQAPPSPAPQQSQPDPNAEARIALQRNNLLRIQRQLMPDLDIRSFTGTNVRYEQRWI